MSQKHQLSFDEEKSEQAVKNCFEIYTSNFYSFFFIVPSVFMMNKNIYMGINSKPNETNVTKTISLKKKKSLFEKNKDNSLPY